MASPKNFYIPLTLFGVSQFNTSFIFTFSSFTYKSFSANLFTTFSTTLLCSFASSFLTIISSMKFTTFPVLIKSYRILFIIVWNIAGKFISPKNITIGLNDSSNIINAAFHSSSFFIYTLLYPHYKSNLINTSFVPIFFTISKINSKVQLFSIVYSFKYL